jgi:hypothetical protein
MLLTRRCQSYRETYLSGTFHRKTHMGSLGMITSLDAERPTNTRPSYGTALGVILFSLESHADSGAEERSMLHFQ